MYLSYLESSQYIYMHTHIYIYIFGMFPPFNLDISTSPCSYIEMCTYVFVCMSVFVSLFLSTYLSVYLESICLSILNLSIYLSISLSTYLSLSLSLVPSISMYFSLILCSSVYLTRCLISFLCVGYHCGHQVLAWHALQHSKSRLLTDIYQALRNLHPSIRSLPHQAAAHIRQVRRTSSHKVLKIPY